MLLDTKSPLTTTNRSRRWSSSYRDESIAPADVATFEIEPIGHFSLAAARDFAGGFPAGIGAQAAETGLLATFPLEGWAESAAVNVWQTDDGVVHGEVHGTTDVEAARRQVARSLSLDHDGVVGWRSANVTRCIGAIGRRFDWLRPVCFYSAYEAATSFVIGQRISMRQGRVIKDRLAGSLGDPIEIAATTVRPFPRPQRLLEATDVQGLSAVKLGSHPGPRPGSARRPARHRAAALAPGGRRPRRAARPSRCRAVDGTGDPDAGLWRRGRRSPCRRHQPGGGRRRIRSTRTAR